MCTRTDTNSICSGRGKKSTFKKFHYVNINPIDTLYKKEILLEEVRNVQTFIKKLYRIVSDPNTNHIVSWSYATEKG